MGLRKDDKDDNGLPHVIVEQHQVQHRHIWWAHKGAWLLGILVMAIVWYVMILPNEVTPKTQMVDPATEVLDGGISNPQNLKALSRQLKMPIKSPDLRQIGGKLVKSSAAVFGGVQAAVMQFQYGKSVFLLYRFQEPSKLLKDMRRFEDKGNLYYYASGGSVAVVVWKDKQIGFNALAAKSTEADLLALVAASLATGSETTVASVWDSRSM